MKKILALTAILLIGGFSLLAQDPPPPPNEPSGGNNPPVGGGSPVGSGLTIMLALGAAYGGKKIYELKNK